MPTVPEDSAELVSAQAISLPSGAATMAGMGESFTAQLTTGVAAYSVPFALPGGRAGFSPALSRSIRRAPATALGWRRAGRSQNQLVVARQSDRGLLVTTIATIGTLSKTASVSGGRSSFLSAR